MIDYIHNNFGFSCHFWTTIVGSALPRASIAALMSLGFYFLIDNEMTDFALRHPYSIGMVAGVISFSVIFRSNSAIQRYYEGAASVHNMMSKWGDCALQTMTFHSMRDPNMYTHEFFVKRLIHLFSLASAVACLTFRQDADMNNVITHLPGNLLPNQLQGSRPDRDSLGIIGYFRYTFGMRSGTNTRMKYNQVSKFPVLSGASEVEKKTLNGANGGYAKVAIVLFWITDLITAQYQVGALGPVSPPVVSRLYQELSDGMLWFNQGRKIAYLPFPFVFAQGTEVLMGICVLVIPLLMKGYVVAETLGAIMTFGSCLCFFTLYEACRELEDPFLYEPNDLPLLAWQSQFNEMLLSVSAEQHNRDDAKASGSQTHPSFIPPHKNKSDAPVNVSRKSLVTPGAGTARSRTGSLSSQEEVKLSER